MFNIIWLKTLTYKEVSRVFRIWKQTILPPVITSTLYLLIFWNFLWSRISDIDWLSYINFILPWLILMSVITASYSNSSSSFFWAKFQKSIEELLVSPMPNMYILTWYVLGWVIRGIMVWLIVLIVALFFTDISIFSIQYLLWFLILTSNLFALAGFLNWLYANSFDDVTIIPTFIITPLTYLWWVFYSVSMLPNFWQIVNLFNPILYMINWFRYWFIWKTDVDISLSFLVLLICNIILFFLNLYLLNKWFRLKN